MENPEIDRLLKNWLKNLRAFANLLREFTENLMQKRVKSRDLEKMT